MLTDSPTQFAWKTLSSIEQLNEILASQQKVLIFKHSTRCSISSFALKNFERSFHSEPGMACYFLDLLKYREVSNEIASRSGVRHESPQVLVFEGGKAVYNASHHKIEPQTIMHI